MMNSFRALVSLPKRKFRGKSIEYTPRKIESQPKLWLKNFKMLKRGKMK